jgi:purine-binding chemotaxis protein CheW
MSIVDTNVDDQDNVAKGDGDQLQLVTFEVADEEFAVNILAVQEINRMMEITRVPQAPPEVQGVINLRGKIIPVVDIRKRFNLDARDHNSDNRIIVVKVQGRVIGFIVDCVHEVLRINTSIVEPPPSMITSIDSDFIEGVGKLDDRLIILLDLEKLFATELLDEMERVADAKAA